MTYLVPLKHIVKIATKTRRLPIMIHHITPQQLPCCLPNKHLQFVLVTVFSLANKSWLGQIHRTRRWQMSAWLWAAPCRRVVVCRCQRGLPPRPSMLSAVEGHCVHAPPPTHASPARLQHAPSTRHPAGSHHRSFKVTPGLVDKHWWLFHRCDNVLCSRCRYMLPRDRCS